MSSSLDPSTTGAPVWSRFRALLESQRAECVQQRELALAESVQSVADVVAHRRSADLQTTIGEIDAALARIDAGTYGWCVRCGSAVPEERLELRPFAVSCVGCAGSR